MSLHARDYYLTELLSFDAEPMLGSTIRIITGVRRCGKSSLLQLYRERIVASGGRPISINFEDFGQLHLTDAQRFHTTVTSLIQELDATHLLIDEVQELSDWARVINSLRVNFPITIVVTGSNASMFAGEGLTYLAGRYVSMHMLPLSLAEFRAFRSDDGPVEQSYPSWMQGTLPALALTHDKQIAERINLDTFASIFTRDITLRGNLRDPEVFLKVARTVFSLAGSPISVSKIANTLTSQGVKTTHPTIDRYLGLLCDAHMLYHCPRFDVEGRGHLKTTGKYYFVDPGLRNSLLGSRANNRGHDLENMVYLELRRRGYEVATAVPKRGNREIDFRAVQGGQETYIQVALSALDQKTLDREISAFDIAPAGAKRVVITFDHMDLSTPNVSHVHAGNFLCGAGI